MALFLLVSHGENKSDRSPNHFLFLYLNTQLEVMKALLKFHVNLYDLELAEVVLNMDKHQKEPLLQPFFRDDFL